MMPPRTASCLSGRASARAVMVANPSPRGAYDVVAV
jgi:hypothetical protein